MGFILREQRYVWRNGKGIYRICIYIGSVCLFKGTLQWNLGPACSWSTGRFTNLIFYKEKILVAYSLDTVSMCKTECHFCVLLVHTPNHSISCDFGWNKDVKGESIIHSSQKHSCACKCCRDSKIGFGIAASVRKTGTSCSGKSLYFGASSDSSRGFARISLEIKALFWSRQRLCSWFFSYLAEMSYNSTLCLHVLTLMTF